MDFFLEKVEIEALSRRENLTNILYISDQQGINYAIRYDIFTPRGGPLLTLF